MFPRVHNSARIGLRAISSSENALRPGCLTSQLSIQGSGVWALFPASSEPPSFPRHPTQMESYEKNSAPPRSRRAPRCSSSWCGCGTAPCPRRFSGGGLSSARRVLPQLVERRVEVRALALSTPRRSSLASTRRPSRHRPRPFALRAQTQYHSPAGSASAGVGSPSRRQRSMKCSCDPPLSFNSEARHLAMNWPGVIAAATCRYALATPSYTLPRVDQFNARFGEVPHVPSRHGHAPPARDGGDLTVRL